MPARAWRFESSRPHQLVSHVGLRFVVTDKSSALSEKPRFTPRARARFAAHLSRGDPGVTKVGEKFFGKK